MGDMESCRYENGANPDEMIRLALEAQKNAYAPYSNFHVGASVLADNGRVYTGCNIENASYGATICAERTAVGKAVSDGAKRILAVAVTSDSMEYTMPCGICRQVLSEFCAAETPMYLGNRHGEYSEYIFRDIFPHAFVLETDPDEIDGK